MQVRFNNIPAKVDEGCTILEAARQAGIEIPTLCHMEGVHEIGACRICVVEVKGAKTLLPACITKAREGMEIFTHTPKVRKARKTVLELLLSNHDDDCLSCVKNNRCELQRLCSEMNIKANTYKGEQTKKVYDDKSPAIIRDSSKCILCRRCITACSKVQGVSAIAPIGRGFKTVIAPAAKESLVDSPCVMCGQCVKVCPTGALTEKSDIERVWKALGDPELHVVVQVAPAVRVTIGEMFGQPIGTSMTKKLITALRLLGFDRVFDTNFSADLTIMEEGNELLKRIKEGGTLPMITSCSPGWINYLEYFFPELMEHLSTCKSPQQMFGAVIKTYYAHKMNIPADKIFTVSVMPCTAKKYECSRPEMYSSGYRDVDAVLTTRELGRMLIESGRNIADCEDGVFDDPFGPGSGAGAIFGNTGGVMEAALRTVYEVLTGEELKDLRFTGVRGLEGIKVAEVQLGDRKLSVAAIHSLGHVKEILEDIKSKESPYTFIEIMCCPGGCIGGGGQPISDDPDMLKKRMEGLYREDEGLPVRKSHENPAIQELYREFLIQPLGHKSHELLHTHYMNRKEYIRNNR